MGPPWFFTVFVTFTVAPGARAVDAVVAVVTMRSGPIVMGCAVRAALFPAPPASGIVSLSFARAKIQ